MPVGSPRRLSCRVGRCPSGRRLAAANGPRVAAGFAYLLALLGVFVVGLGATYGLQTHQALAQGEAERQLLRIGTEFERALESYAAASPPGALNAPRSLEELLRDPRHPGVHRHLRTIRIDPLTRQAQWGLRRGPQGEILGVHSLASGQPLVREGFAPERAHFANARSYADWVFAPRLGRSLRND